MTNLWLRKKRIIRKFQSSYRNIREVQFGAGKPVLQWKRQQWEVRVGIHLKWLYCGNWYRYTKFKALQQARSHQENKKRFEDSLLKMNISVVVAWVPAHDKIEANEKVDRQAKEMVYDIFKENIPAPKVISFLSAVKLSTDIAMKSWQRKWELETVGYYTRQLIPEAGKKVIFPVDRVSASLTAKCCWTIRCWTTMLIALVLLSRQFVSVEMRGKQCNTFLLRCPLYREGRICMLDSIKGICASR